MVVISMVMYTSHTLAGAVVGSATDWGVEMWLSPSFTALPIQFLKKYFQCFSSD